MSVFLEQLKHTVLAIILAVVLLITCRIVCSCVLEYQYNRAYREIELNLIAEATDESLEEGRQYWKLVKTEEGIKKIATELGISLDDIDYEHKMLVISYGAELKWFGYNLKDKMIGDNYIGLAEYEESAPCKVFIYLADQSLVVAFG